jgi:hypothetical protein
MELADGVLAYAEQIQCSYARAVLALRVESEREREQTAARARVAISRLGGGGEIFWSADLEPAGVIVRQWGCTPDIAATLAALTEALDSSGVEGRVVVHAPDPPAPRASLVERSEELLECHVRVRGERRLHTPQDEIDNAARLGRQPPDPVVRFFPDDAALLAGLRAALAWVGSPPAGAELRSVGDLPHRDIGEVSAHLAARLAAAGGERSRATSWAGWESDESFRSMYVNPGRGDVSFAAGGGRLAAGDGGPAYEALLDELGAAAAWGSYGLIKRGRHRAHVGGSLAYDWVPALHYGAYNLGHHRYEDVLAPDAFGAQLLGPPDSRGAGLGAHRGRQRRRAARASRSSGLVRCTAAPDHAGGLHRARSVVPDA